LAATGNSRVKPSGFPPYSNSLDFSAISAAHSPNHEESASSELQLHNKSDYGSQGQDNPYSNYSNNRKYENRFSQNSTITDHELMFKLSNARKDNVTSFRIDAASLANEETKTTWKELINNDDLALILWDVTNKHVGFKSRDESVEKCLDEFNDERKAIAPYLVSTTVRENEYFLRDFINNISKYSHLHDLNTVQNYYDQFREILKDQKSYYKALKQIIENMDQDMKYAIICAQRRFCSCFSSQDIVRYEEQFCSLSQYNFLMRTYLIYGYYIDPIIRGIFIVTGLILNCAILIIFAKHKDVVTQCDVMVMNIAVNGILILIVYTPLHYIHFYYSSIIPHEEFSDNGVFASVQSALISVSGMSLLTLRARYHVQIFHPLNSAVFWRSLSTMWQHSLCVLTVWMWAFSVATLTYMFNDHPKIGYLFAPLVYIALYVLTLPIAMYRFKIYSEKGLVPPEGEKIISSTTVVQLSKMFWMTHVPLLVWLLLERLCGFILKLASINYSYVDILFCYVYLSYTCVNTLALCRGSYVFRKLLYRHVFRCSYKLNEQQDMMLNETGRPACETQSLT
jgi:hypothetical protein